MDKKHLTETVSISASTETLDETLIFKGKLTSDSMEYLDVRQAKFTIACCVVLFTVATIAVFFMLLLSKIPPYVPFLVICTAFIGIAVCTIVAGFKQYYPDEITISDGKIQLKNYKKLFDLTVNVNAVRCVYDCGKFYYIKFKNIWIVCGLCQKDLLTNGSLSQFESIFAKNLIRKI